MNPAISAINKQVSCQTTEEKEERLQQRHGGTWKEYLEEMLKKHQKIEK